MVHHMPHSACELEQHIRARTGRRIQNLAVELAPGRIVLRGRTNTYYVKQLAQHGVQDLFPQASLVNAIVVDSPN
jgi:methyl coenzyme M reductase subunit C-like uncharacterized protein (methanogenesis marker protein 7)